MGWGLAGLGNSSAVAAAVVVAAAPQNVCLWGNGFLRERVEHERSRREITAILIVRTLRIFLKKVFGGKFEKYEKSNWCMSRLKENTSARNLVCRNSVCY